MMNNFLTEITRIDRYVKHKSQRKLFLLGLGSMLECESTPNLVSENYHIVLSKMIIMLGRIQITERIKHEKTMDPK